MTEWGFDQVNRFARATPWLHGAMYGYATYGVVLFAALLLTGWWIARQRRDLPMVAAAICAGIATLLAVAINQPIVGAVHEARPYTTHPGILVLAHRSTDFAFPSDHAVMAGAAAVGLWFVSRRLGAIAIAAAAVIAFSRVYIAAHYPQDVAVGLVLGGIVATIVYYGLRGIILRIVTMVDSSRLSPLVRARTALDVR